MAAANGSLSAFEPAPGYRSLWLDAGRRLIHNRLALASSIVILVLALIALFAPLLAPHAAREQLYFKEGSAVCEQYGPTSDHLFGVDPLCRDTFSRMLYGARVSLSVGILTQVIVLAIGLAVGGAAGMGGRWLDNILMRFTDATYAFPDLLLIILFASVFRETWLGRSAGGLFAIFLAIGLSAWVTVARLFRAQILTLREREFVLAAHSLGATRLHIFWKHVLPNALGPIIVAITFGIPAAIFAEAALSFIGVGIKPPAASWGVLINDGYQVILVSYWPILFPALAIALTMLCFTFLGDGLRDAIDPRTRGGRRA
jgi:oligopeptide transport system permease protein